MGEAGKIQLPIFATMFVLNGIHFHVTQTNELKQLTLQGFLPMTGSGWPGGGACLPAVLMALRDINGRSGLLDGYNLTYTWVDTQVKCYSISVPSPLAFCLNLYRTCRADNGPI